MARALASLLVVCVAFIPSSGSAQTPDTARLAAVRALNVGQMVRLESSHAGLVEGRLDIATDLDITITRDTGEIRVAVPDVDRLWVRGHSTGRGALIGAGVGLAAGLVFGLLISSVACEPVDGGDCTTAEVMAVTGLVGVAGGAALGAGIGYAIPTWKLRFP